MPLDRKTDNEERALPELEKHQTTGRCGLQLHSNVGAIRVCRFTHVQNNSWNNSSKDNNEIRGPVGDRSTWQIQKNHDDRELRLGNRLKERRRESCQCRQDSHPWPSIYVQSRGGKPLQVGSRMNHNTERKKRRHKPQRMPRNEITDVDNRCMDTMGERGMGWRERLGLTCIHYLYYASLIAQMLKNPSANQKTVWSLGQKLPLEKEWLPTPAFLPGEFLDRGAWWATVSGVTKSQTRLSD